MRIVGLGAGGHARVVLEILQAIPGHEVVGLLDADRSLWGGDVLGVPVLGGDEGLEGLRADGVSHAFLGLGSTGDVRPRIALWEKARSAGFGMITAVHPTAVVSPSALLGEGATVMAGAVLNAGARLGRNVIVNTGAVVEHDCVLEDHVHVATGAVLASTVHVGEAAHVGAGASVRQCVRIGAGSVVGAGAAVVEDVARGVVVGGVPARFLKEARP